MTRTAKWRTASRVEGKRRKTVEVRDQRAKEIVEKEISRQTTSDGRGGHEN